MNCRVGVVGYTAPTINDSTLAALLCQVGIFDSLYIRLAHMETGYYTSNLCLKHHNLFGLKYFPGERSTTASGFTSGGFASYDNYLLCVVDLKLYLDKYGRGLRGYCGISKYREFLTKYVN